MTRIKIYVALIFLLPLTASSQKSLYYIEKPSKVQACNEIKEVICMFEEDATIGKFTNDFTENFVQALAAKNIKTHKIYKTPHDSSGVFKHRVDSIMSNYNPNGLLLLNFNGVGIFKSTVLGDMRKGIDFKFQYSYMKSQHENYIYLYLTHLTVDKEKISELGNTVSDALIDMMRKKKVIPE